MRKLSPCLLVIALLAAPIAALSKDRDSLDINVLDTEGGEAVL